MEADEIGRFRDVMARTPPTSATAAKDPDLLRFLNLPSAARDADSKKASPYFGPRSGEPSNPPSQMMSPTTGNEPKGSIAAPFIVKSPEASSVEYPANTVLPPATFAAAAAASAPTLASFARSPGLNPMHTPGASFTAMPASESPQRLDDAGPFGASGSAWRDTSPPAYPVPPPSAALGPAASPSAMRQDTPIVLRNAHGVFLLQPVPTTPAAQAPMPSPQFLPSNSVGYSPMMAPLPPAFSAVKSPLSVASPPPYRAPPQYDQ